MDITVVLCTYNRSKSLASALNSAAALVLPESVEWEILVVDNNSNDRTREVVADFCSKYPSRFRYLFEPQQGKSHALNAGIREARGSILAFMDDDVTVESKWLQNLTSNLNSGEWSGAGGRILPAGSFAPPRWLPLHMGGILALFDLGEEAGKLDRAPFGTNMAFRKEMFHKYGGFRTDLGPCPGSEIRNEDTEFGRRLMEVGERLRYEPSAIVYHAVPEDRLKKDYFLTFSFDDGRSTIRTTARRRDVWGIPRPYLSFLKHLVVLAPVNILRWLLALGRQNRFYRKCWVWCTAGEIVELYRRLFIANTQEQNPTPRNQADRTA